MELIPNDEKVYILNLSVNKELNNTYGSIIKWVPNKQRYIVKCDKDNKKRLIKDNNLGWVKIRTKKPEIKKNTTTFFISELTKNCLELQKLIEIFIFPPSTKYNSNEYFNLEIQERKELNFVSLTIDNQFLNKVMKFIHILKFKIKKGKPLISMINSEPVKQLESRSVDTFTLHSEKINMNNYKPLIINKNDIDNYLNLNEFKNILDWAKYYWPDRNISKNKSYYGILKFFNDDGILPNYFFI